MAARSQDSWLLTPRRTDSYFLKTKAIVGRFGDREATYAVFMRRPVICTPRLAIEFLEADGEGARHQLRRSSSTIPRAPGSAPASRSSI